MTLEYIESKDDELGVLVDTVINLEKGMNRFIGCYIEDSYRYTELVNKKE